VKKALVAIVVASALGSPAWAGKPPSDPQLLEGEKQVASGEYDKAIATLTAVVRRLGAAPGREEEVAQAYLNLGLAYAGLGQLSPAKSQFIQALMRDPSLKLDPKTAPKAALEVFEEALHEGVSEGVVPADRRPKNKHSPGKLVLAAVAVGAGVTAAAVGAAGGSPSGSAPAIPPNFVPVTTSPYIQLVTAIPSPGTTFSAGAPVSVTVSVVNTGTDSSHPQVFIEVDAVTADARPCLRGQTPAFPFLPGANVTWAFPLDLQCSAPFVTESLYLWLQDAATGARPYFAVYQGRYSVIPATMGN
jgi:hypothetical protein